MRPTVRFLTDDLIKQIVDEAIGILCTLGLQIHNKQILSMLADHKSKVDMDNFHVKLTEHIVQKAIESAPSSFKLYDVMVNQTHDFSGYNVYFTPGSTALNILDCQTQQMRKPLTSDFVDFSKIMAQLEHIASTSTAFIPTDLHERLGEEVDKLLQTYEPSRLPETTKKDLTRLMEAEARRCGQDRLPLPPATA